MASTATIEAFVDDAFAAFDTAWSRVDGTEHDLRLAGRHVRIRYAAPELDGRFLPALTHARGEAPFEQPDLVIACWDGSVTGVNPPPPPWGQEAFLPTGRIRGHAEATVRASYDAVDRVLCVYDRDRRAALLYAADHALVPTWMDRAPFRTILTWWASDRGLTMLHASAVADGGAALAISGPSGSGKSTTALTCLTRGLGVVGDDACLVDLAAEPTAFAVYGLVKVEPDALDRLPSLRTSVTDLGTEKVIALDHRLVERGVLRAVAVPHVVAGDTAKAIRMSPGDALRSLATSTMMEGIGGGSLPVLGELVRRVPCVRLELGSSDDAVVQTVRDLLGGDSGR